MFENPTVERAGVFQPGAGSGHGEPRVREGSFGRYEGRRRSAVALRSGAAIGAAMLALTLTACTDASPSEAVPEPSSASLQRSTFDVNPGQLRTIAVLDDCDPDDPAWDPVGGCVRNDGKVSFPDFLSALPQGHPAWQNDPAYATVRLRGNAFRNISVVNQGGREHTFTRVADFGGGFLLFLNAPGQPAVPECATEDDFGSSLLTPGASLRIASLQTGVHRYQCCFHPWMRTELRVE